MVEDVSPLQSVGVRVAYEGGVTVGVPIGNDEYVLERTRTIVKEGGTDHLARCLANMPDKRAAALIITESLGQRTGYLERALDTEKSFEACRRAQWAYDKNPRATGRSGGTVVLSGGGCPDNRLTTPPPSPSTPFYRSGKAMEAGSAGRVDQGTKVEIKKSYIIAGVPHRDQPKNKRHRSRHVSTGVTDDILTAHHLNVQVFIEQNAPISQYETLL